MSLTLQVGLLIFASWAAATGAAFLLIRWLIVRQHDERADLLDRCMEMIGTIHTYQVAAHLPDEPPPGQGRVHYTEEEEDVLARTDTLSREELSAALAEAEFLGTEVQVDE